MHRLTPQIWPGSRRGAWLTPRSRSFVPGWRRSPSRRIRRPPSCPPQYSFHHSIPPSTISLHVHPPSFLPCPFPPIPSIHSIPSDPSPLPSRTPLPNSISDKTPPQEGADWIPALTHLLRAQPDTRWGGTLVSSPGTARLPRLGARNAQGSSDFRALHCFRIQAACYPPGPRRSCMGLGCPSVSRRAQLVWGWATPLSGGCGAQQWQGAWCEV